MRRKCIDGVVRSFQTASDNWHMGDMALKGKWPAKCLKCGYEFGYIKYSEVHEQFINHICEEDKVDNDGN